MIKERPFQLQDQTFAWGEPWLGFSSRNQAAHRRGDGDSPAPKPKRNHGNPRSGIDLRKINWEEKRLPISWGLRRCHRGRWPCLGFAVCTCRPTTSPERGQRNSREREREDGSGGKRGGFYRIAAFGGISSWKYRKRRVESRALRVPSWFYCGMRLRCNARDACFYSWGVRVWFFSCSKP